MRKTIVCLMMTLLLAASLPLNSSAGPMDDIPTNAAGTGEHDSLVAALTHAGLVATLQGTGPFTVFAPTDQAFAAAGIDLADFDTPEENATLSDILLHHVYSGEVLASAVTDGMMATMVNGDKVKFGVNGGAVTVGAATVTNADVMSSNGIIHVIDTVLIPPVDIPATAQSTTIHDSLVAAVIQADLLTTLQGPGPFTVFAPTDQAFVDAGIDLAALDTPEGKATLSDILLYHVVSSEVPASAVTDCMEADAANGQKLAFTVGDSVMVNDATVTMTDVITSNGLIHVIDKVLRPSETPNDIPRTAQCTGIHDSLVAGVIQAELLETLQGPGPFTVFAPTDQAFVDAGIDLAALDTPEGKATLSDILLYHVVAGEVPAANVSDCMSATAVNGQPLTFTVDSSVMVNGATVIQADVGTSNGFIHVIDKVLTPTDTPNDIPRTAQCTGIHDSLVAGVIQAELLETLQGTGPFTLFAPTDQAFADAGIDLAALDSPEGKAALTDILLYHVIAGQVPSSAVTECLTANTVNGNPISFTVGDSVKVNDATVTLADVNTSNGVIHVIDKVLTPTTTPNDVPRTAQCTGIHDSLVAGVIQAGLLETLQGPGPFTVFAPTDQAFTDAGIDLAALDTPEGQATLSDILLYHVVAGEVPAANVTDCMSATAVNGNPLSFTVGSSVMVNGATVTATDVVTSNGIIHVIDKVLSPTETPNDIPRTAQCTGIHDSLVAAVIQADLLATLQGPGPFTVFAPTDQAFADAGIDLATLDTPEGKATLADILLYHVVSGEVPAANVTECMSATAVNGQPLSFTVGDSVMVNGATVTLADVGTSNGVIHVIDKVLSPTDTPKDIPRTAQCTGIHDSLVAAVVQAELLATLQGDGPFTLFAPTDQAFTDAGIDLSALDTVEGKAALTDILLYHVVAGAVPSSAVTECMSATAVNGQPLSFTVGDTVMINGATVTLADVNTSNGVIHVIDKVLSPTDTPNDLPRTAQCTGVHNSLVAAVIQAELLATLQGEGPFTLFAPTDQAFADAGIDLAALDTPEGKAALTDILLYHVYAGAVMSANITDGMVVEMVNGDNTTLTVTSGMSASVLIGNATVTGADVMTSNGIIHVIDKVLMPPVDDITDTTDTTDTTGQADGASGDSDDEGGYLWTLIIVILVLGGGAGALLFMRSRGGDDAASKEFGQDGLVNQLQPISTTSYAGTQAAATTAYSTELAQQYQSAQQTQQYQPAQQVAQPAQAAAVAQVQPIQTVEVIPQPAVAEPTVLRQWTDDAGYTWRALDDGNTYWWTGTEWQKYS
ncbi:MAG: fasciclin domain-containing protein [Candidatus Poseidoniales archaeon]|nr:MAG: fasciclin domain-containing protein [Candidatus Poseidoniales archaeon]